MFTTTLASLLYKWGVRTLHHNEHAAIVIDQRGRVVISCTIEAVRQSPTDIICEFARGVELWEGDWKDYQ